MKVKAAMADIGIIEWNAGYHQDFISISKQWLEQYVSVEPEDLKILNNPQETVLDKGGNIFFARYNDKVIGTVAMIKLNQNIFELAKLGVAEQYKGLKIGSLLMKAGLDFAEQSGADKVILYTNRKLVPAISLYRKFGFVEIPLENNKYVESDMKMEIMF